MECFSGLVNTWARGDSNPGPPPRQGGVIPLDYGPREIIIKHLKL